jgi:ketosteroid isomerase-like protein
MNELINTFYDCFKKLDADGMIACYHDEIIFKDPAFGTLKGDRAKAMWQMLCASQKGKDFTVEVSQVLADEKAGKAHWEAKYTFSKTGRKSPQQNRCRISIQRWTDYSACRYI